MFAAFLVGFAIRQDAVQFKFQPKVGEKYRYSIDSTDELGNSIYPEGSQVFMIYKVAGEKDGKLTVHQMMEEHLGGKSSTTVLTTLRIDPFLNAEVIATDQQSDAAVAGVAMVVKMLGLFGYSFSPMGVKTGETWKSAFDPRSVAKGFLDAAIRDPDIKMDADGSVSVTLDKLDDKIGSVKTLLHFEMQFSGSENGRKHKGEAKFDCDQTSSIDRLTGIPIKIDRRFSMSTKIDSKGESSTLLMHMVRV